MNIFIDNMVNIMVQVEEIEHIASTSTLRSMEETSRSIDAT
jgi:hypothetical protein